MQGHEHRAFSDPEGGPVLTLCQDHWETADSAIKMTFQLQDDISTLRPIKSLQLPTPALKEHIRRAQV